jgi:alkylhydroperoxidase/carboxymuconolactone decarboxylase family protein YurZ
VVPLPVAGGQYDRPMDEPGLDALAAAAPDVAAGEALLQDVAWRDGALSAAHKALIAAAVAASKGHEALLRALLERARDAGAGRGEAWGAAAILPTSRGVAVAARFADAVLAAFGAPEQESATLRPDADEATAYFIEYYGALPPRIAFLAETASAAYPAFYLLHRGSLRAPGLDPKIRELILCAVNAADLAPQLMLTHAVAARGIGATRSEIVEGIVAVLPVAGLAVWSAVADTLAALD